MRLLKLDDSGEVSLIQVPSHDTIPYAILSHTWIDGNEVTYEDIVSGAGKSKTGYEKINFCRDQAFEDGLEYFWVDTCCIRKSKSDPSEVTAAINSMFRWYRNAAKCYVYLTDVSVPGYSANIQANQSTWETAFKESRWFTRGWTLQELIAPTEVEFFTKEGNRIGNKKSLEVLIHEITSIPVTALRGASLSDFSIAERRAWAEHRTTQKEEDIVYCLIGLCGVSMPTNYGEGKHHALKRLEMTVDGFFKDRSDLSERFVQIRRWLSAPDPSFNYRKALRLRQPETGLWFLKSEIYSEWKRNASSFLWLYGIPGCGKTILSSTIIQDVLFHCTNDTDKVVAYFYFDFNNIDKQNPQLMVQSLISQLSEQCTKMPLGLEKLYLSLDKGNRQPSLDALMDVLQQMLQEFLQLYLILDALDECVHRIELMEILKQIAGWQHKKTHVLVTSRKERDIQSSLENIVREDYIVSLRSQIVDKDIQLYVHQRLLDDPKLKRWQNDPGVRAEIEATLTKGSRGMFRWAVCQLETLGECRSKAALRRALGSLPTTLDETYERILCAISDRDSTYAMRILRWLVFASRPLSLEELAEVAAIDVERGKPFDRDEVFEDQLDVLNVCSSLVSLVMPDEPFHDSEWSSDNGSDNGSEWSLDDGSVTKSSIVTLAHYSVEEYLVSERICCGRAAQYSMQPIACHGYIANGCIIYLLQFEKGLFDQFKTAKSLQEVYALAQYSAKYWIDHARSTDEHDTRLSYFATKLLSAEDGAYLGWLRLHNPDDPWAQPNLQRQINEFADPLYYACLGGLVSTAGQLIEEGAELNGRGRYYGNALQAASHRGHEKVVELLLNNGADVNAQGGKYSNPLYAASTKNNDSIVMLLLDKGAEVNFQVGDYGNALQAASANGHNKIVELLLNNGASINAQGGLYVNALQAASANGHNKIVELLLNNSASINAQGGFYVNALQAASANGRDRVVMLLLDRGAEVNLQGGDYGNALQAASANGHNKTVELLLNKSVDICAHRSKRVRII